MFSGNVTLADYLKMDEAVMLYYFQCWENEEDAILRDLCSRFVNRRLFKYVEFHPSNEQMNKLMELNTLFKKQASIQSIISLLTLRQTCRMTFIDQERKRKDYRFIC